MILRAEQIFDKVYLDREDPSDFIDYISYGVERELVDKVMTLIDRSWNVWKLFNAKTADWLFLGARNSGMSLEVMDFVRMEQK